MSPHRRDGVRRAASAIAALALVVTALPARAFHSVVQASEGALRPALTASSTANATAAWTAPRAPMRVLAASSPSTRIVSVRSDGVQGFGFSVSVAPRAISDDGRFVAFSSNSALVADDADGSDDIWRRDMQTSTTVRVSVAGDGGPPDGASFEASISSDGRFVAFGSNATNLSVPDGNTVPDVFVRDLLLGTNTVVTASLTGTPGGGRSSQISANGRYVVFQSDSADLVLNDTNGWGDVFIRDLVTGTTVRASLSPTGGELTGFSDNPVISGDGRFVAFVSSAPELNPFGSGVQVYVRDMVTGSTELVSRDGPPGTADRFSDLSVSDDGRLIAFRASFSGGGGSVGDVAKASSARAAPSAAANPMNPGVYVRDRQLGTTTLVVEDADHPVLSRSGKFLLFSSFSPFVPPDTNTWADTYVLDRSIGQIELISVTPNGFAGNDLSAGQRWESRPR